MQTFLPYPSFIESVAALDYRRLGKQRIENKQIINVLEGNKVSWQNHPAVKAWEGCIDALKVYHDFTIKEWTSRGYKNTMPLFFEWTPEFIQDLNHGNIGMAPIDMPWWLGNENFHRAHRARLIEKLPEYYEQKWPEDKGYNGGKYWWPVMETKTFKII